MARIDGFALGRAGLFYPLAVFVAPSVLHNYLETLLGYRQISMVSVSILSESTNLYLLYLIYPDIIYPDEDDMITPQRNSSKLFGGKSPSNRLSRAFFLYLMVISQTDVFSPVLSCIAICNQKSSVYHCHPRWCGVSTGVRDETPGQNRE